jgi:hypothetical protein
MAGVTYIRHLLRRGWDEHTSPNVDRIHQPGSLMNIGSQAMLGQAASVVSLLGTPL